MFCPYFKSYLSSHRTAGGLSGLEAVFPSRLSGSPVETLQRIRRNHMGRKKVLCKDLLCCLFYIWLNHRRPEQDVCPLSTTRLGAKSNASVPFSRLWAVSPMHFAMETLKKRCSTRTGLTLHTHHKGRLFHLIPIKWIIHRWGAFAPRLVCTTTCLKLLLQKYCHHAKVLVVGKCWSKEHV